jgi:hypothetical protein
VSASHRVSDATACTVDVKVAGASILTAPIDLIPLVAPAAVPTVADRGVNGAVELGAHSYKVGFVTAGGETEPSAASAVVTPAAPAALVVALKAEAGNIDGGNHSYKVTNVNANGESVASAKSNVVLADGGHGKVDVTLVAGPAGTTARKIYRTVAGDAGDWLLVGTVADNVTLAFEDNLADGGLGAAAPAGTGSKITLTNIPLAVNVGGLIVTGRRLYRTVTGDAGDYKLVDEIGDNVTTSYVDNIADGALGVSAPAKNTATEQTLQHEDLTDPTDLAAGIQAAKEAEVTVDVAVTGTEVDDLNIQIDYLAVD